MPIAVQMLLGVRPEQRELLQLALLDAGLLDHLVKPLDATVPLMVLDLPSEDALFRLSTAMRLHGIEPGRPRRFWRATPRELAASELLSMFPWIHSSGRAMPRSEREYDRRSACPVCGAGLRPAGPLRLRKTEVPKKGPLGTVSGCVLIVHDDLRAVWQAETITGIAFERALDREGTPLPWHEVLIQSTLPAMSLGSTGMLRGRMSGEAPCQRCGQDGWFDDPEQPFTPRYERSVLESAPDIANTHERFGAGELCTPLTKSTLAKPRLIVRRRVYELCRRLKLRGIRFTPAVVA